MNGGTMRKRVVTILFGAALAAVAEPALAIPAFARRYGVACDYCHQGYPKLNPVGQRFKERGLRMDQEDPFVAADWLRGAPVSLRAYGTHYFYEGADDWTTATGKLVSAGSLGRRLSYWADYNALVRVDSDDTFDGAVDNAWAQLELVSRGRLYAKLGRFELDLPFTQARSPHPFPYEIYFATAGSESDAVGYRQEGIELGGGLPGDVRWSAAIVAGRDDPFHDRAPGEERFRGNLFLRASKRVLQHRAGAFAYIARDRVEAATPWDDDLLRLGVDGSAWVGRLNLYGLFLYGRNGQTLPPGSPNSRRTFTGGFLQADHHLSDRVVLTLRTEMVQHPRRPSGVQITVRSLYPGVQLYLRERFKLAFEYGLHNHDIRSVAALQAELAF
jgi:hypothetical protein